MRNSAFSPEFMKFREQVVVEKYLLEGENSFEDVVDRVVGAVMTILRVDSFEGRIRTCSKHLLDSILSVDTEKNRSHLKKTL